MTKKDYSNSKIYKIEPIVEHSEEEIYIGSTTKQYLSQRITAHRYEFNKWENGDRHYYTCFQLFSKYGINNCEIILLENVNATSKDELHAREAFYIKSVKCVNKSIPLRTDKEYQNDNREKILQKHRDYYEKNKERIAEKDMVKITCKCGSIYRRSDKSRHEKSKKHLKYLDSINGRSTITTEIIL